MVCAETNHYRRLAETQVMGREGGRESGQARRVLVESSDVCRMLQVDEDECVVEIGSDLGHCTAQVARRCQGALGFDKSSQSVAAAKRNYPDVPFCCADVLRHPEALTGAATAGP
jgi:protein-L-isoaspartate O-methyltransferase